MAMSYVILEPRQLVCSRATGALTDEDLFEFMGRLRADPQFRSDFCHLADFRSVTALEITAAGVRRVSEIAPFGPGSRRALVAESEAIFGMARMYELVSERGGSVVRVFRHMDAALGWLELPGDFQAPDRE